MTEKVAGIEVKLSLNDREYASSAKNAEKSTEALDESVEKLQDDLRDAGDAAAEAGKDLDKMGKKATTARGALNNLRKEAKYLMSFGGIAGLLGGGAVGAFLSSAWNASAANAVNMQQLGLAAGGNQNIFNTMNDLYRQINSSSPISSKDSANIAAQVTKRFGYLSGSERSQLADKLTTIVEGGDDVSSVIKSLDKIAKVSGGKMNVSEMLDMLNYTANQTNESISSVATATAALTKAGKKSGIDAKTAQQFFITGSQRGDDVTTVVEAVLRGIETSNTLNAQRRPSARRPAWMDVLNTEYSGIPFSPYGYLDTGAGLVPTQAADIHRSAQLTSKRFEQAKGDFLDNMLTRPKEYIFDYLYHNFDTMLRDMYGGEENYARVKRGEFTNMPNHHHPDGEGSVLRPIIQPIIYQYFSSSDSPSASARKAIENEMKEWARS